ncbi:MAG: S1/P1 nuclease [Gemmataceae bacterium]|nr:S1/P1 nuclease [Gemmataceae bacterium]
MRVFLLVVLTFAVSSRSALAWNKAGHMVTAAIAYAVLKEEKPEAIPRIIAILKEHPQYESLWAPRLAALPRATEDEKDMYLFMQAARWPDDARSDEEFHRSTWHYINLPFKPAKEPASVRPLPPDPDNIVRAYELNLGKAKDRKEEGDDRAVSICWVFHLIGDAHQPLHTSSLYTTVYPRGDKGGNKFYIRAKPGASGITLHQYWDDMIIGSERFQSVRNRATELRLRPEFAKEKLPELKELSFEKWVSAESFPLVVSAVYRNGLLAGGVDAPSAVALPDDYSKVCKPIAEKMAVLAGRRMAAACRLIVAE